MLSRQRGPRPRTTRQLRRIGGCSLVPSRAETRIVREGCGGRSLHWAILSSFPNPGSHGAQAVQAKHGRPSLSPPLFSSTTVEERLRCARAVPPSREVGVRHPTGATRRTSLYALTACTPIHCCDATIVTCPPCDPRGGCVGASEPEGIPRSLGTRPVQLSCQTCHPLWHASCPGPGSLSLPPWLTRHTLLCKRYVLPSSELASDLSPGMSAAIPRCASPWYLVWSPLSHFTLVTTL